MKTFTAFSLLAGLFLPLAAQAIDLKQSKFTQVVNSVDVIAEDKSTHAAAVSDVFKMPEVLRTGAASRAEMVAEDKTITRVGADTIFSFDPANRAIDLKQGSLLFHSPHGKGGGSIHTASATAAVLGTTIIVSCTADGGFKVLDLEGEAKVRLPDGSSQTLNPGEMIVIFPGGGKSAVIIFNLGDEVKGSLLVNGFTDPLPSMDMINAEIARQLAKILKHRYEDWNSSFAGGNDGAGIIGGDNVIIRGDIDSRKAPPIIIPPPSTGLTIIPIGG